MLRIGPWLVDGAAGELRNGAEVVRLRPKVMALLLVLAERPFAVWPKAELLVQVWPDVVVTDASLSMTVAELRTALGDDPAAPAFLETIPRRGYRLIAGVERATPQPPRPSPYSLISRELIFPLAEGRTVIGRDPGCDVLLDSQHVSRFHAALEVAGELVTIEDLGSKNGTWVGGQRIASPTALRPGDRVRLGRRAAVLRLAASSSSTLSEASGALAGLGVDE